MSLLTRSTTQEVDADKTDGQQERKGSAGRRRATPTTTAVNLLSPWVLDELRVRRLRQRFVVGAVALLVLVVAVWGLLRLDLARGQQDLQDDQSVGDGLNGQIADLSDVKTYVANVQKRAISVEDAMTDQIAFAEVMRALDAALPAGAALDSVSVLLPPDPTTTAGAATTATTEPLCPGPDPFGATPVIGCLEIKGTAGSRAAVSALVQALGRSDLFIEPFITATTTEEGDVAGAAGVVEFEGTLGLDVTTYTARFADVDGSDAAAEAAAADTAAGAGTTPATPAKKKAKR